MQVRSKIVVFLGLCISSVACGPDSHGRAAESCTEFEPCGGDPTGHWQVVNACGIGLEAAAGMQFDEPACDDSVRRVDPQVSGTYDFDADGRATSDTTLQVDMDMLFTNQCISALAGGIAVDAQGVALYCSTLEAQFAQLPEYEGTSCNVVGTGCACMLTSVAEHLIEQQVVDGTNIDDGVSLTPFCVQGDTMKLLDESSDGSVVITLTRVAP